VSWPSTAYVLPLLGSTAVSSALTVYAWRRRSAVAAARAFALMMGGLALWTFAYALELGAADLRVKIFFACLRYPGIATSVLAFLGVALHFAGRSAWLTPRRVAAAAALPALTVVLAFTNPAHHLMWRELELDPHGPALQSEHGPWFWLHMAYSYAGMLLGSALVVHHGLGARRGRRRQTAVMLASVCAPWVTSILHLAGFTTGTLDPTPFALIVTGVGFSWAVFRFGFLDLVPIARAAVIENMADGMMVLDREGRVLDLNAEARSVLGARSARAIGQRAADVFADFPEPARHYLDVDDGGGEVTIGAGPTLRHYDLRVSPLRDDEGGIAGRVLVWRDVTALKETERELMAQKARLERLARRQTILYEALRLVGGQLDEVNLTRVAVQAVARLTGWPTVLLAVPDANGGLRIRDARRDLSGPPEVAENGVIARCFRTGQTQHVPDVSLDPDYVADHPDIRSELAVPLRRGGRVLGVLNMESTERDAFDAEDALLAESLADAVALALENARLHQDTVDEHGRMESLIEASGDGILFADVDGRLRVLNDRAVRLLGLVAGPEEWRERPVQDLLDTLGAWAPETRRTMQAALRGPGPAAAASGEMELGPRFLRWFVVPVQAAMGHLVVLRDVTEERLLERLRDDLTHTMVHDLRNPLTAVSGAFELIESGLVEGERFHELVRIGRASTDRMFGLVNSILDVSRLESGSLPLERCCLALGPLVEETLRLQTPLVADHGPRLESTVPRELPAAFADRSLVARVLQNLVGNALKYTPEGYVRVEAAPDGEAMVRVEVADSGSGIAEDLRPRLFQKFVTGRDRQRGSGLGLAFCRLAVEAHGGRIWAAPEPGRGSRFSFTLPVAR
jgi:NtrC-family two-component system sensor histidine kinase KinB